jgi:hypothetical protein
MRPSSVDEGNSRPAIYSVVKYLRAPFRALIPNRPQKAKTPKALTLPTNKKTSDLRRIERPPTSTRHRTSRDYLVTKTGYSASVEI